MAFLARDVDTASPPRRFDSAWIGGGSGNCPMTARKLFPQLMRRIDVVEINEEVMHVAQQHFGLIEDEVVRCHRTDGAEFLAVAEQGSYDLIAIDAADHDANDEGPDMEAPPTCFYSDEFLTGPLRRALRPGGFVAVNAIGRREQLADYCERWKRCGYWPVYALAIDPNVVFFAWRAETDDFGKWQWPEDAFKSGNFTHSDVLALIKRTPPLESLMPSIIEPVLLKTESSHAKGNILGWMGVDELASKCLDIENWCL